MPKYYCDYCKSYLTHDTMSVRKSHLMGRNHIKYYCDYYEQKAKQTGIWNPLDVPYEISSSFLNQGAPGSRSGNITSFTANTSGTNNIPPPQVTTFESMLPPPPSLSNFPAPPASVLRYTDEHRQAILNQKQDDKYI